MWKKQLSVRQEEYQNFQLVRGWTSMALSVSNLSVGTIEIMEEHKYHFVNEEMELILQITYFF